METENKQGASAATCEASESPEQVAYDLLIRTASRLEAELNRVFRPFDLTGATYSILRILEAAGRSGRSCGDISEHLIAEVPDMTRLLDRLERLEYVQRERSSIDRRMVKVTITDRGREVLAGLRDPVSECHRRQLAVLDAEKLRNLEGLLRLVLSRFGEETQNASGESPALPEKSVSV